MYLPYPPPQVTASAAPPARTSRDPRGIARRARGLGAATTRALGVAALAVLGVLGAATAACRKPDPPPPRDAAAPVDAAPPPADAASLPIDAAARPAPTPTQLVAGGDSTCAVLSDLTVRCWGGNSHGQLGNGETTDASSPVAPAIRAVLDLQLADATACALLDDHSVACWGRIAWHGHPEDILRPTGVLGVIGVQQIFVFPGRACARLASGSLVCWGNVDARGHFATGPTYRVPTPVVGFDHIAGMTADGAFSDDGRMWRWGSDGVPRRADVTGVRAIAARDNTLCGLVDGGRVQCVDTGRCGPPPASPPAPPPPAAPAHKPSPRPAKPSPRTRPPQKPGPAAPVRPADRPAADPVLTLGFATARQLAFDVGFCVITATGGRLQCGDGCRKLDPIALERVDTMVGRCALLRSGTVTCFDGTKFVAAPGVQRATQLAVGRAHACALTGTTISCWGDDAHDQLGGFGIAR